MKCSLGIFNFLEEISSLSHSVVFLYFFALIAEEGCLICFCYSLELCIQMLISFHFAFVYSHGHHQMVNTKIRFITFFAAKDGEALYSQQKQDWELTVARIMNLLLPNSDMKVGKTTRPFRYDLNQIPYDYTVEVRNKFKDLDLIDRVPDELWNEIHDIVQETGIKTIPPQKMQKKQNGCLGRPYK